MPAPLLISWTIRIFNHQCKITYNVIEKECSELMSSFFKKMRFEKKYKKVLLKRAKLENQPAQTKQKKVISQARLNKNRYSRKSKKYTARKFKKKLLSENIYNKKPLSRHTYHNDMLSTKQWFLSYIHIFMCHIYQFSETQSDFALHICK